MFLIFLFLLSKVYDKCHTYIHKYIYICVCIYLVCIYGRGNYYLLNKLCGSSHLTYCFGHLITSSNGSSLLRHGIWGHKAEINPISNSLSLSLHILTHMCVCVYAYIYIYNLDFHSHVLAGRNQDGPHAT